MPIDPHRVKALFAALLDIEGVAAQAAFLDRECPDDPNLHQRVGALLQVHHAASGFLATPAGGTIADFALGETSAIPSGATVGFSEQPVHRPDRPSISVPSLIGTTIAGRYKVRQEIGEGGMGTVYMAEQIQPVKRMVALKLIRAGMDSRTVLARFESERQALAIMDHPNIARVLDAGTTESGHPFFVMELVRGIPLTEYCDNHRLSLPRRLELFRQICAAVQHAHQKGVIHRDLKPTNILVEDHDGHPIPKVIDFGLAKATTGLQLTEQSLFTAFGSITGTPLYMAPEQATFNAIDIDTRADIYALGVILYELLTGSTPIRKETLQKAALDEMLRVIREDEPATPSSRISTSEGLPSLAANRHVEPGRLGRFVRGDLDWIVMKALAKERVRRYDSVIGLANDVERFLNDEPVTAGPPTARYRTGKFIRRHRRQVVAASLVLLALIGGVIGTTLGLFEARRQERFANQLNNEARRQATEARRHEQLALAAAVEKEKARAAEAEQHLQAEKRLLQLSKLNEILGSIFHDINPENAELKGKPLAALLGERLTLAAAQIEGETIGDPLMVARTQQILGGSQIGLGYFKEAADLLGKSFATFSRVLGPDNRETIQAISVLGYAYYTVGKLDQAIPMLERAIELQKATLGPNNPETLVTMNNLAISQG